uniref:Uncharacterized protein n=1 Tax=Kalanchoe fedtschenkoi TaxID=63787 RepID=A0A7N0SW77_KALFE
MEMVMKRKAEAQRISSKDDMNGRSFCERHVRGPCKSFGTRCNQLVKEQRARFYILRRCVTMLVCWHEYRDIL